jgi:hypothetical protein
MEYAPAAGRLDSDDPPPKRLKGLATGVPTAWGTDEADAVPRKL